MHARRLARARAVGEHGKDARKNPVRVDPCCEGGARAAVQQRILMVGEQ